MPVLAPTTPATWIADYASLKTQVANWLHRADLVPMIPTFIAIAEAKMNGDLDARDMEVRTTLTATPDGTPEGRYVALPTDMLEMRRLLLMTDPAIVLAYKTPDQLVADQGYLQSSGVPTDFAIVGADIELSPTPDQAYSIELVYKQRIPALTDSNTTNWVLNRNPNVYLFGALMAAMPYIQNDERLPMFAQMYEASVNTVNGIEWYSGSTMRVRAR